MPAELPTGPHVVNHKIKSFKPSIFRGKRKQKLYRMGLRRCKHHTRILVQLQFLFPTLPYTDLSMYIYSVSHLLFSPFAEVLATVNIGIGIVSKYSRILTLKQAQ